ncbi:winged helix-turn-helix domain-containing protein [Phaeobacter sp. B1627]|uniref:winged helix-turn-helix domain-containing protein n=1 Tax=Phaeobacter sp. B1627 TaxID=2583809 RepID=UPI00159ED971|nr:winged helix-turn-helix domain-containing protein [Phaeobacter sp. B1627]
MSTGREQYSPAYGQQIAKPIQLGGATYCGETDRLISATGEEVLLRWQSAQVLRILVGHLNAVVSRDELILQVWGGISVTDDSLTQCIADIRRALGDRDHALLKTLRKRGYLLQGEVLRPPPAVARVPHPAPAQGGQTLLADLDPRDVLPTLAILPLRNLSGTGQDPLGVFVADEISGALGRSRDVNIISRLSTEQFQDVRGSFANLRQVLNADFVISGVLLSEADTATLSVEFAETESGFVLWSDRMRLRVPTILTDTDWVDRIVSLVRNAIMVNEVRRVRTRALPDLKLFSLLHGAVGLMHRLSPADFNEAREHLEYAAQRAPRNPAPLAWLARWHLLRTVQGWTDDPKREAEVALGFTARALDIDPGHTLALVCEGQVLTHMSHQLDAAAERYEMALSGNPNDAQGRALRGMLETFRDNGALGKRDTERALHLTPLDPHRFFYLVFAAAANLAVDDFARAETLAKESLRLNRTHVSTLRTLAVAQVGMGKGDTARETAGALLKLQPDLSVSGWLKASPSAHYQNGRRFADMLREAGVPD